MENPEKPSDGDPSGGPSGPTRRKKYLRKGAEYVVPRSTRHYNRTEQLAKCASTSGVSVSVPPVDSPGQSTPSVPPADSPGQSTPVVDLQRQAKGTNDQQQLLLENDCADNSQQHSGECRVGSPTSSFEDETHFETYENDGADSQLDGDDVSDSRDLEDPDENAPPHVPLSEEIAPEEDDDGDGDSRTPQDIIAGACEDEDDLVGRCFARFGTSTLPHSSTTKASAVAMLMAIVHAHNFSWSALDDVLKFVNNLFGQNQNVLPGSKYLFRKLWTRKASTVAKKYFYCERTNCGGLLQEDDAGTLTCTVCSASVDSEAECNYFTILDVGQQVKHVIAKTKQTLSERLATIETSLSSPSITDITSGSVYRNLKEDAVVKPGDLTLTVNTDGSPVFKSSRSSIWPIQFTVSELPPEQRFRSTTLAGLWFGPKHPNMMLFMGKFVDVLMDMEPIEWTCGTKSYKSQVHLICCCADAPARAAVQNHVLYSGYFGCPWCLIRGKYIAGCIRYPQEEEVPPQRTPESLSRDTALAKRFREPVEGVKGPSALASVPYFDPVWGYPVDYMHCVLLGVTRQLTELFLGSCNSEQRFYIGRPAVLCTVNERLLSIRPPHSVTRLPRSLLERAFWKASEWRLWLLFYGLPCTLDVLPSRYWKHFARLSEAVHILLRTEVTPSLIDRAEKLLKMFVAQVPTLYGETSMSFNIHQLLHLANTVRQMGPLWANSAFPFETGNGQLLRHITAAKGIPLQVVERAMMYQELEAVLSNELLPADTRQFCSRVLGYSHLKEACYVSGGVMLGSATPSCNLSSEESTALLEGLGFCPSAVVEYKRLILAGQLCHSVQYTRAKKSDSTVVQCEDGKVMMIWRALHVGDYASGEGVLLCKELAFKDGDSRFPAHIREMDSVPHDRFVVMSPNEVSHVCLLVKFAERSYVCMLPNNIERD